MTFKVCLIHHIKTVGVRKGIHLRVARIMARAHCVQVGLFHQGYILFHCRDIYIPAKHRMRIMDVGTLEEHTFAIDGHISFPRHTTIIKCRATVSALTGHLEERGQPHSISSPSAINLMIYPCAPMNTSYGFIASRGITRCVRGARCGMNSCTNTTKV